MQNAIGLPNHITYHILPSSRFEQIVCIIRMYDFIDVEKR